MLCLGRNPSLHKNVVRRVRLARYFDLAKLPPLPSQYLPPPGYKVPMFLNDVLGICGPAACAHALGQNSLASSGVEILPTDAEVKAFYFGITGGVDSGVDMESMLSYWRTHALHGEEIVGYAALDPGNTDQLEAAMYIFEGAVINGASLPDRVVPDVGDWVTIPWTGSSGSPNPNNGHAFSQPGYVARGGPYFVTTWADCRSRMDKAFYAKYVDAPFVVLTHAIINQATQKSGNGFDAASLQQDIKDITSAPPPDQPPTPPSPGPSGCLSIKDMVGAFRAAANYLEKHSEGE